MIIDYDKKIKDIITDYFSTIGKFHNVTELISQKKYEINENDNEETIMIKKGMQREILVDLGRVAEMAFKYIIKIRRMELYPNEHYLDEFINGNLIKGFKETETLSTKVVKDLGNTVHASKEDIETILNTPGIGPKAHNFYYLYLIIDKLMPDVSDKLNQIIKMKIKSENFLKFFDKNYFNYPVYYIFPNKTVEFKDKENISEEEKKIIEYLKRSNFTIENSGDIFNRLRYYANNPFDKEFNVMEIFEIISNIIYFIKIVHLNNDGLNFNPEIIYSYYNLINKPEWTRFTSTELLEIYSFPKIKNNLDNLISCLFYSKLTFEEIKEIANSTEINENDLKSAFSLNLNLETILYMKSLGIEEYYQMDLIMARKSQVSQNIFPTKENSGRYTISEYKSLINKYGIQKYPQILEFLINLSCETINNLQKNMKLLSFFENEFYFHISGTSYQYSDKLFNTILSIEEVQKYQNSWYGMDTDQLFINHDMTRLLTCYLQGQENNDKKNFYIETIVKNIKENIECYKCLPKMLCIMPLMLNPKDNKHNLETLIKHGLDIKDLRGFDSTILCYPTKLVDIIEKLFIFFDIPLIIENKVNPLIKLIVAKMILENLNENIKISQRRLLFFKSQKNRNYNLTNNPIIDELTIEKVCLRVPQDKRMALSDGLKNIDFYTLINDDQIERENQSFSKSLIKK